jgi:hypothetical protein
MHSKETIQQAEQNQRLAAEFVATRWKSRKVTAWQDISRHLAISKNSMPRLFQELQRLQLIACIGTAHDAGRKDIRSTCKVYAPYGVALLSHVPLPREPKPVKYKGERTGKHYTNWRTPELTLHSYDLLYAGRNLAMLAR